MEEKKYKKTLGQKLLPYILLIIIISIPTIILTINYINKIYYIEISNVNNENLVTKITLLIENKNPLTINKSDFANMQKNTPKEILALNDLKNDINELTIYQNSKTYISIFITNNYENSEIYYKGQKLEFGKRTKFVNK